MIIEPKFGKNIRSATLSLTVEYEEEGKETQVFKLKPGFSLIRYRGEVPLYEETDPGKVGHVLYASEDYLVLQGVVE